MASESISDPEEYERREAERAELSEFLDFFEAVLDGAPELMSPALVGEYVRRNGQPLEGD